jgi:hypothetical protein
MARVAFFSLVILFFLLFPGISQADTVVGGTISTDTTWTLAGSPYIVTSNIIVRGTDGPDNTTTLTIEAGVAVRFNSCLYVIVGFSSNSGGALLAEGTADQPVVFTSNQATPAAGDWQGIIFRETAHTSTLSHCKVRKL